jgi:hypothetical protein
MTHNIERAHAHSSTLNGNANGNGISTSNGSRQNVQRSTRWPKALDRYVALCASLLGCNESDAIRDVFIYGMLSLLDAPSIPIAELSDCTPRERQAFLASIRGTISQSTMSFNRRFFLLQEKDLTTFLRLIDEIDTRIHNLKGGNNGNRKERIAA